MPLICPECGARYEIDTASWPTEIDAQGRTVFRSRRARCRACDTVWDARPQVTESKERPDIASGQDRPDTDAHAIETDAEADSHHPRRRRGWLAGILALAIIVPGVALGLNQFLGNDNLPKLQSLDEWAARHWSMPQMALPQIPQEWRRFRLMLPRADAPPLNIEIRQLQLQQAGPRHIWELEGRIHNETSQTQPLPGVEILLLDKSGAVQGRSVLRPDLKELLPGERTSFHTSIIDPPETAVRVRVRLKPAELGRL